MNINEFDGAEKIADIEKDKDNSSGNLKVVFVKGYKQDKKAAFAEVSNDEVVNIFESSDIKAMTKYYESTESTRVAGDKASDTNYAKYWLAKKELEEGKKFEIWQLQGSKEENLEFYYKKEKKYPKYNFQKNNEKIPEEILKQKEKDEQEYKKNLKK